MTAMIGISEVVINQTELLMPRGYSFGNTVLYMAYDCQLFAPEGYNTDIRSERFSSHWLIWQPANLPWVFNRIGPALEHIKDIPDKGWTFISNHDSGWRSAIRTRTFDSYMEKVRNSWPDCIPIQCNQDSRPLFGSRSPCFFKASFQKNSSFKKSTSSPYAVDWSIALAENTPLHPVKDRDKIYGNQRNEN